MGQEILIGLISLGIAAGLVFVAWPRGGASPRFLQFEAALVLYPPLVMVFFVMGVAELITVYSSIGH